MLFNSLSFLIFFPVVVLIYFLLPAKTRYIWLLVSSYFFYMCWNPKYVILLLLSTASTFVSGLLLHRFAERKNAKRAVLAGSLAVNLGILFVFKYFSFVWGTLRKILLAAHISVADVRLGLLLPVGISFYIFQAVGYTIDIYRNKIAPEKNFFRYALFVSFFPQLVAGPIERSDRLLSQFDALDRIRLWDSERLQRGALAMLYGYLLKMVIADRAAIFVNAVFDCESYSAYRGLTAALGAVLFSLQIYCDFAGYSYIAIGAAQVMGIRLTANFATPYFSASIKEFWDRWHISLSTWFRDYLYFPLGGSRRGKARKYLNILIVFAASGLWHGAAWHYVVWGALHGIYRIAGELTANIRKKLAGLLGVCRTTEAFKLGQILITFVLVTVAWVFFRAESLHQAADILKNIVTVWDPWVLFDGSLFEFALDVKEFNVLIVSCLILFAVSLAQYKKRDLGAVFVRQNTLFKLLFFYAGIFFVMIYGVYGMEYNASQFIYFQF